MSDVTPGWRFVAIVLDGDPVSVGGVNPWGLKWRRLPEPPITVAHPSWPEQRHRMFVYELDSPSGPIKFAAGEFSLCAWGFYVPDSGAHDVA